MQVPELPCTCSGPGTFSICYKHGVMKYIPKEESAVAKLDEKVKSVMDYIDRADLTDKEIGELVGALLLVRLGKAVNHGIKDLRL